MSDSIINIRDKLRNEFVFKLIELRSISINDLPIELKFAIMSLLPVESVRELASVSSLWRDIARDEYFWRILVKRHFPSIYYRGINEFRGESWKRLCKVAYRERKLTQFLESLSRSLPPIADSSLASYPQLWSDILTLTPLYQYELHLKSVRYDIEYEKIKKYNLLKLLDDYNKQREH